MQITLPQLPLTPQAFAALAADRMTRPEGTAALLIVALKTYIEDREAGLAMLEQLQGPRPLSNHDRQFIRDRLLDKPYLPDSYLVGARPDNNYTPDQPLTVRLEPDPVPVESEEFTRLRLSSSGADSPRLVSLRQQKTSGIWYLWDYPGFLSGIRIPLSEDPWA